MRALFVGETCWDSITMLLKAEASESPRASFRFAVSMDEGPCNALIANFLRSQNARVLFWIDGVHRINNSAWNGLRGSGSELARIVKATNRLFKTSRGPWKTQKFGKQLQLAGVVGVWRQLIRSGRGTWDLLPSFFLCGVRRTM
jgi:hypothetical protein